MNNNLFENGGGPEHGDVSDMTDVDGFYDGLRDEDLKDDAVEEEVEDEIDEEVKAKEEVVSEDAEITAEEAEIEAEMNPRAVGSAKPVGEDTKKKTHKYTLNLDALEEQVSAEMPVEPNPRLFFSNPKKFQEERLAYEAAMLAYEKANEIVDNRPRTRADCVNGVRPCPRVSCKHNLYLDVNPTTGSVLFNFPHLEVWEMGQSCVLDIAEKGGSTLEEVGACFNLTRERIRQLEVSGLERLREEDGGLPTDLREVFSDGYSTEKGNRDFNF